MKKPSTPVGLKYFLVFSITVMFAVSKGRPNCKKEVTSLRQSASNRVERI